MKITSFNGSPWGPQSNTQVLVSEFLAGACEAGAHAETILLSDKKIKPCERCFACAVETPGKCKIKDDMSELLHKFISSDVVIFATPVYLDNVTAAMKTFMDRLQPLLEPHFEKDPRGEYRHRKRYDRYPKFVAIATAGMPERSHFRVLKLLFRRIARNLHTEVVAEIYCGAAGVLNSQQLNWAALVHRYKQLLRLAGKEFAQTGLINTQTLQQLKKPLVDADEYMDYANKMWDRLLAKPENHNLRQQLLDTKKS